MQKNKSATANLIQRLITGKYQHCHTSNGRPYGFLSNTPCYSSSSRNRYLLILDSTLQHIQVQQNEKSVFANIFTLDGAVTISSQNSPPSTNVEDGLQDWADMKEITNLFLLLCDLNAHSKLWGCPSDNDRAHHLITHMAQKRLLVANDHYCKPTFETRYLQGWRGVTIASFCIVCKNYLLEN